MESLNTFSLACMYFGLLCAAFALIADYRERRRLRRVADIFVRVCAPDTRPNFIEHEVPWKHTDWWKL
jgi:hypothetical protein